MVWLHQCFQRKQLKGSPTQATWRHVDFPADDHARELGLRPITTQSFGNISSELRVHINLWRKTHQDTNHFKVLKRGIPDSIQQTYSEICALLRGLFTLLLCGYLYEVTEELKCGSINEVQRRNVNDGVMVHGCDYKSIHTFLKSCSQYHQSTHASYIHCSSL